MGPRLGSEPDEGGGRLSYSTAARQLPQQRKKEDVQMDRKIGLFDAIRTTRAMRRLKPDPVPDELIREILEAAICAPSGGDAQHWRFIVVKDP